MLAQVRPPTAKKHKRAKCQHREFLIEFAETLNQMVELQFCGLSLQTLKLYKPVKSCNVRIDWTRVRIPPTPQNIRYGVTGNTALHGANTGSNPVI